MTSLGHTERRRYDVATTSCCRVGDLSRKIVLTREKDVLGTQLHLLVKVNDRSTRKRCEIGSKLTISFEHISHFSSIFILNFEQIRTLMFPQNFIHIAGKEKKINGNNF